MSSDLILRQLRAPIKGQIPQTPQSAGSLKLSKEALKQILETKKNSTLPTQLDPLFQEKIKSLFQGGVNGGGGDDVAIEIQSLIMNALGKMQKDEALAELARKLDLVKSLENIQVFVLDDSLDLQMKDLIQKSVAVNIPELKMILVNRLRWSEIKSKTIKEGIALHEYLSIHGVERTGYYPFSGRYTLLLGSSEDKLTNALAVNRIQQMTFQHPSLTKFQILENFFKEATEPISLSMFDSFNSLIGGTGRFSCGGVEKGENPNRVREAQQFGLIHATVTKLSYGEPSNGPLFPGIPDTPAKKEYRLVPVYEGEKPATLRHHWTNPESYVWIGSTLANSDTEIVQSILPLNQDGKRFWSKYSFENEGTGARYTIRKNNGLIVYKVEYFGEKNSPQQESIINTTYNYCYPKTK